MSIGCDILSVALDAEQLNWVYANNSSTTSNTMRVYVTHRLTSAQGTALPQSDQEAAVVSLVNYNSPSMNITHPAVGNGHQPEYWNITSGDRSMNADGSLTTVFSVSYEHEYGRPGVYPVPMKFAAAVSMRSGGSVSRFSSAAYGQPGETIVSGPYTGSGLDSAVTIIYSPARFPQSNPSPTPARSARKGSGQSSAT